MIVNLNHFKKQWSVLPSFGITYLNVSSPNPRKVLQTLTVVQLWLQLLSIILLLNSCLDGWYISPDANLIWKSYLRTEYGRAYFIGFLVLQIFEIAVAMYASYHLRYASTKYNYAQEINTWTMVNNIYLMTSILCIIYSFSKSRSFIICLRIMSTGLFTVYKVYIVYQIYKNEKSSTIVLEQNAVLLESSTKSANSGNSESSQSNQSHVVVVELGTTVNNPTVNEDNDIKAATTISKNEIVQ